MKKFGVFLLAFALLVAFSGCSKKAASSTDQVNSAASSMSEKDTQMTTTALSTEDGITAITEKITTKKKIPENTYKIIVNIRTQVATVLKKDSSGNYTVPVKNMVVSTGVGSATPTGTFKLSDKYRWHVLKGNVWGQWCSRITGPILFHSVPYARRDPASLKTSLYNQLGRKASSGCIRLEAINAKWIYDNCPSGTQVQIGNFSYSYLPSSGMSVRKLKSTTNWDPSDPTSGNPFYNNNSGYLDSTTTQKPTTTTQKPTTTTQKPTTTTQKPTTTTQKPTTTTQKTTTQKPTTTTKNTTTVKD